MAKGVITMNRELMKKQVESYVDEYIRFMGIENFPAYDLLFKEVSLSKSISQGFEAPACASYDTQTHKHTICVATNLELMKCVVFHEFTHMLDSEKYVYGDKMRYLGLSGYTEYHASQIELAQLLGSENFANIPSFTMNTLVSTISGEKSVSQYIREKQEHAIELFSRNDFPASIEALKSSVGVLYNYWGLRSICEMYATDFTETVNNSAFLKFIPTIHFSALNRLMYGWLDKAKIDLSIPLYINIVCTLIRDYKLA